MLFRPLALLCAIAIVASLFLPWAATPLGPNLAPWSALPAFDSESVQRYLTEAPNNVRLFLMSFFLAALFLLTALVGWEKRWLAFLTGACVVGLAGSTVWRSREALGLVEPEMTMVEANRLFLLANDVLGTGGWAWIGGGALMLLLGVFDPGRAKPHPITSSRW